jgi:dihydroorotase
MGLNIFESCLGQSICKEIFLENMTHFLLPLWYDLHAHFRQGASLPALIKAHIDMGCAGILAMPNTKPPVGKLWKKDALPYWSIEEYTHMLEEAGGNEMSAIIVPLYLTQHTTPQMIAEGAKSGILKACKYYPPHGTTGSEHSWHFSSFMENGVFDAMEEHGIILCAHGEEHSMKPEAYFGRASNAEEYFYRERLPRAVDKYPNLKIVGEHLTTKAGVDFVLQAGKNVAATITPQHLLYTVGHLLQGLKYHLYCLPLLKFEEDRAALRQAVSTSENSQFFAGTDSAPHTTKVTDCGCAAGCFTGGVAPQLYAEAFELAGVDLATSQGQDIFKQFLCTNGADFYGLPLPSQTFTLAKKEQPVTELATAEGSLTPLPLGIGRTSIPWSITL